MSLPGKQVVPGRATGFERRRRASAALLGFLAASAAVHAAVIVALPDFRIDRTLPPVTVLEVVLVQSGPPPSLLATDARAEPSAQSATRAKRDAVKLRSNPKPVPKSPVAKVVAPLLTLPEPEPAAEHVALDDTGHADASTPSETSPPARVAVVAPTPPSFSASYLQNPAPRYPLAARRAGEQGTVTLKVLVTSEGLPRRVEIEKTSGSSRLDTAALDAVKRWRFVPARRGATPIESWVLVPVVFRLEDPS